MKQVLILFAFILMASVTAAAELKVKAFRLTEPITVDGKLNEKFWKDENAVTEFFQRDPVEGAKATEKTVIDIGFDDEAIYIGARMYDSQPKLIEARLVRKDVQITSDQLMFYVDPYHDRRSGYYFGVNAAGTLYDGTLMNDTWDDNSWDGVWQGEAHVDDKGWTVEMRIPYSQLRFQQQDQYVWGVNFLRTIARKNETDYLVVRPKKESVFVSRFADLTGIGNIKPQRRIEIMPYVTNKASFTHPDAGNPFNDGSSYDPGMGADMKFGIGTNLNLDATANPDFGQVEVDPAVINLSDVETFFQEKRPFFIEGSSIFNFGEGGATNYWGFNWAGPIMFYSRRIGRTPQGSIPDSDYQDAPDGTSILGAGKLTGKIGHGWTIGTLHAFTGKETADYSVDGTSLQAEIEPKTYYQVTRGLKEFGDGRQGLGFMATLALRIFDDLRLEDEINGSAYVYGIDGWTFLDSNKTWVVTGWSAFSTVKGNTARMTDLQQNSQHYFQRPDADYVEVDPNATSLSGAAGRVYLNKEKGNFFMNAAFGFVTPGFDNNDVGFLYRADQYNMHVGGGYKWTTPGKYFRYAEAGLAAFRTLDFGGDTTWSGLFHFGYVEFKNYYTLDYSLAWNPEETLNNTRTRGGPQTLNLPGYEVNVFAKTDTRKKIVFGLGGNLYEADSSHFRLVRSSLEWKPRANLSLTAEPSLERTWTPAMWIDNFDDPFATHTYGKRYVFADFDQRTFVAGLRVNWTFTPRLSLQLYGQPLISSGKYTNYKELARPSSYAFNIYGNPVISSGEVTIDPDGTGPASAFTFDDPNFNFKSLRGNAILRWEYKPGSTIYFVWTQTRTDEESIGNFQLGKSFGRLWKAESDNIFLIKFSYYWNP
jgi:Domain of unknown function (DUF5916)